MWYSRTLRDWLGMLYVTPEAPPFHVQWTDDVLAELLYHLRKRHPPWGGDRISGIRDQIAGTFEIGRVKDFEIGDDYRGRDPFDAHVHAAAVACQADVLLTANVNDFEWDEQNMPYEVQEPDEFLVLVDDSWPELVSDVAVQMCGYWLRRSTEADFLRLTNAGCPQFADRVRRHLLANAHKLR